MSDSGTESRKRKSAEPAEQRRISYACLPCRRRKVRCSGTKPCCQSCLRLRDKCEWPGHEGNEDVVTEADGMKSVNTAQRHVLIDLFFNTPHLDILRQSIHRLSFEGAEINQQSEFLLASICCLAALYVSKSDVGSVFNGESSARLSQRLADVAQKFSRDTSDQPTVQYTQANLLLGFRELLCRTGYKAWMYIGLATRMGQALRLGREYHQRHSTREQEVRRRTAWTCFIMDKLVASVCSRPQTMRAEKLRVQLPCPERSFLFGEIFSGPVSFLNKGPDPDTSEVLPYFIKAIEHWGIMTDIMVASLQDPPSQSPTDSEGAFYKAEAAVILWKRSLPSRMQWSLANYRAHRLLGQGSMFVSMHFILNHCLCAAHQEYLPEFEGDPAFDDASSPEPSSNRSVVRTCLGHADEITRMASLLYSGDETDREMLRAPFVGLALESAACCHLWRIHRESQDPDTAGTPADHRNQDTVKQKLSLISDILKSWSDIWPIASSWYETIDLLSRLYHAVNPSRMMEVDENRLGGAEENRPLSSGDITIGSGYPYPQNLKSHRMFDNIRLIIMTASDPPGLRNHQTRLHIQSLWARMFLFQQITPNTVSPQAVRNDVPQAVLEFAHFSTLDDMLNSMDDFNGFDNFDPAVITNVNYSAADRQHSLPFP